MSFPRYPKYKDSGVEWLGKVPEHWGVLRGRRLFTQKREPARADDEQLSATQKYGVVPQQKFMELEEQKVTLALSGTDNFKHVEKNDFVISLRSFQGGIERSVYSGCVSPAYTVLRPTQPVFAGFWGYLLKSSGYIESLQTMTDGIRDGKTISYQQFGQIGLPVPSLPEQAAVAAFLDHETAKIDALIAEQQRLIELLQEKRQAVISHAVTKGLNPDAPMKDSGIEWLGAVPEHWGTSRLKHATAKIVDCPHETPTYCDDGDYLVIRTPDLDDGRLLTAGMNRVDHAEYTDRTRRETLQAGDIVYSREGGRWGHAATVPASDRFCLGQRMMQFRSREDWDAGYLMWHLTSRHVYAQGEIDTAGAASPHVNVGTISNYRIASPPLDEQSHIARVLSSRAIGYDDLTNQAQNAVALLQERRSALISAAVTGQIDVRGLAGSEAA